jgi:multisubunit Na+/H+ antiporter MnhE subunit
MIRYVASLATLTLIYAGALASFAPADLLFGALLACGLLLLFRPALPTPQPHAPARSLRRVLAFFPFMGAITRDIVVGTWTVARIVVTPRPTNRPGVIAVPLGERTRAGVFISALALSLSPGSTLIAIDWEHRVMLLHLLDAHDPERPRADLLRFYERYQRHVFP